MKNKKNTKTRWAVTLIGSPHKNVKSWYFHKKKGMILILLLFYKKMTKGTKNILELNL